MIKSVICDLLGIEKPIFQGGMAWIADARLAAAVSNAGGLGLISSINFGTEAVRAEIRKARELMENSGKSIYEIAMECGFPNSSNFYRLYKKHTGESPRQGRAN